jgi:hypothetical protein
MIRLTLTLHGIAAITTKPLTRAEADARTAAWSRYYYRVGVVAEVAA